MIEAKSQKFFRTKDEAGVNLAFVRLYARPKGYRSAYAPGGQRARGSRPHKRGKNVSMIGAISRRLALRGLAQRGATRSH